MAVITFRVKYAASYVMVGRGKGCVKGGVLTGWIEYKVDWSKEEVDALTAEELGEGVIDYLRTTKYRHRHITEVTAQVVFQ